MKQYGFRHRILLLAVALVVATQLITLFPLLDLIKRDSDAQADRTVGLAGALFDEYMHNRDELLLNTVSVLVSDFPFKQAVASGGDDATIRSVLRNHANRVDASVAALLDPDGNVIVSSTADEREVAGFPECPVRDAGGRRATSSHQYRRRAVSDRHRARARAGNDRVGRARLPDRRRARDASAEPHGSRHLVGVRRGKGYARAELDASRERAKRRDRRARRCTHRRATHR